MIPHPNFFRLQTLGNRVLKEPQPLIMQHRIRWTPLASTVARRIIMLIVAQSTSIIHPNSRNACTANPPWRLYPGPSSVELRWREGESSDYGGSSELRNRGVRYISRQFYSILSIPCIIFFSAPQNLGVRFLLKGVVLSHPKISNFRMWLKFTKF
jgi:hypothetical protein